MQLSEASSSNFTFFQNRKYMISRYLIWLFAVILLVSCDKNEEFEEDEVGANIQLQGTGSFVYNDYSPLADKPITVYYHVPDGVNEFAPVVFIFHGAGRDAKESRDELISKANLYRNILIVPEFSQTYFRGSDAYNLGNVFEDGDRPSPESLNPEEEWTFSLIEPIFDFLRNSTSINVETYNAIGFSAGAQFLHRFLYFKPQSRIQHAVVASAGWYTIPDFQIDFPYGLAKAPVLANSMAAFYSRQTTVVVGEADNDPNASSLRRNSTVDQQGTNRLARAQYFYNQSQVQANHSSSTFNWTYLSIPNATHDFQAVASYAMDNALNN